MPASIIKLVNGCFIVQPDGLDIRGCVTGTNPIFAFFCLRELIMLANIVEARHTVADAFDSAETRRRKEKHAAALPFTRSAHAGADRAGGRGRL